VHNSIETRLTGPVNRCVFIKLICFVQNPSAAMRGGFFASARQEAGLSRFAAMHFTPQ
jgi:hypothetical protein